MSRTDRRRRSKPSSDLRARFLFEDLEALGIEHAADLAYRIAISTFPPVANPAGIAAAFDCFDLLNEIGIPFVVCGGWATDFQLGRVLRDHSDIDLFVLDEDEERMLAQLGESSSILFAAAPASQSQRRHYDLCFRNLISVDLAVIEVSGSMGSVWDGAFAFGLDGLEERRRQLAAGNRQVDVRTLSPELHYLFKLAGLRHFDGEERDKDLADIRAMLPLLNLRRLAEAKVAWRDAAGRLAQPAPIE